MKNTLSAVLSSAAIACAFVAPAQAEPIRYTLQDLNFDDGSSASGYFVFDTDTGTSTDFNVSITAGALAAFTYSAASGLFITDLFGPNSFAMASETGARYLNITLTSPATGPGLYGLDLPSTYDCDSCSTARYATSGSVVGEALVAAVPEPATLALMLPVLGALGVAARRRRECAA